MEIVVEENPREHAGRKEKQNAYEEWENSIRRKIPASSSKPFKPRPTIFRVPEHIRGGNENAYKPMMVSIGPYHRAREKFVDKHKWRYVQAILQRNPSKNLADYLNGIKELEDRARSCYRETTEIQKIESNDFVEMMFVDGCFLVELFLKRLDRLTREEEAGHQDDIIYSDRLLAFYLICDLCLLENQLPYFILECIFEGVMSNDLTTYFVRFPIVRGTSVLFKKILSSDKPASALLALLAITFIPGRFHYKIRSSDVAIGEMETFHHLLHLFHYSLSPDPDIHSKETPAKSIFQRLKNAIHSIFSRLYSHGSALSAGEQVPSPAKSMFKKLKSVIPSMFWGLPSHGSAASSGETAPSKFPCLHSREKHEQLFSVPSVTKLDDAGVKFRRAKNPGSILNIKFEFECGVMKIPYMFIGDSTNFFFRNLIAFEQCHQGVREYFSMYAALMDCLINTRKDIEILSQHGIIEHGLGSDKEVALLFNQLGKGILVDFDDPYLSILFKEVTNYCSNCWPRSRATLCRDYFSSPWAILSMIAAIILLLLTVAQTIFSFLSYFRPPS